MNLDLVQRGFDVARLVTNDFNLNVFGQLRSDARQGFLQTFDYFDGVGA